MIEATILRLIKHNLVEVERIYFPEDIIFYGYYLEYEFLEEIFTVCLN